MSVIVPVRNRRALLSQLLDALAAQTVVDHEVIVIDDGSTDGSADAARCRGAIVVDGGGRGAVAARNAGVAVARADVLAFTDSDCVPSTDWLAHGLAAIERGVDVAQGLTRPDAEVRPLERTVWVTREDGLYATCNIFYRRAAFEAAGGFDGEAGRRLGFRPGRQLRDLGFGEDTLLGWRVRRAGRSVFVPEALVHHHVFPPDPQEHVRRAFNAGGFAMLVREVPELRQEFLTDRVWLGRPTRLFLYGALPLALARRWVVVAACIAGWTGWHWSLLRSWPGSGRRKAASLPVVLAGDAVTAASLVVGSARSRAVVL